MSTERARRWAAEAIDERDSRAVLAAIDGALANDPGAIDELKSMFSGALKFGTAGLRARMGAGESQMNTSVIARATWGLGQWLLNSNSKSVVICYDARQQSDTFAQVSAEVLSAQGLMTYLSPQALPTPVLAYAVAQLEADAGVMITASHNPRGDNGYKVYLGDGCQIAPPVDSEIAALIATAPGANQIARDAECIRPWPPEIWHNYIKGAADFLRIAAASNTPTNGTSLTWVYTPMHGVGAATLREVVEQLAWPRPTLVESQLAPDGEFPTLPFPNPEEEGALDQAIETADAVGANLIVANDPDADRCAIAVRRGSNWHQLTGDEVGALLAERIIAVAKKNSLSNSAHVLATTLVSSTLTNKMAESNGFKAKTTLTGFKWIGRIPGLIYGYEEALGYCVDPAKVKDKDGITAALLAVQLHREAAESGQDLLDVLDDIYSKYGLHFTDTQSLRFPTLNEASEIIARISLNPPDVVASLPVHGFTDLTRGFHDLPPTAGVLFYLGEQVRVIIRPSGTEPKIKTYLELVYPPRGQRDALTADKVAAHQLANQVHTALRESLLCPTP